LPCGYAGPLTPTLSPQARGEGEESLVIIGKRQNAERIVAVDAVAEERGLRPGLGLAEARAMHPGLVAVEEDPAADAQLLINIADWCGRYTPLVATDPPDGLLLDIGGCAHLFGGERALLDDLLGRMARFGFEAYAAVADTIGAAWAAARFSDAQQVVSGAEHECLAPLPLAALRLSEDTVAVLARVGLKRIGDIIDLPRAPLVARFGEGLVRQLDRALAREREPLNPRLPVPPYFAEQKFPDPIAREEDVLAVAMRLATRLRPTLERRGEGARRIELCLFRTDGAVRRIAVSASRPLRDPQDMRALLVERLAALADELDPGFGFDLARLSILQAEPLPEEQAGLGQGGQDDDLARLTDQLSARLGVRRVNRLVARDSHIPELAVAVVPAQWDRARADDGWEAFRRYRKAVDLSERPLRLLAKPEPIEARATVPDGPPIWFRWRRAEHRVAAVDGPERIEDVWWNGKDNPTRDYFRVEDVAGRRFWLFRAGLYGAQEPAPSWFMHGLFA
jgi:protein ImuB